MFNFGLHKAGASELRLEAPEKNATKSGWTAAFRRWRVSAGLGLGLASLAAALPGLAHAQVILQLDLALWTRFKGTAVALLQDVQPNGDGLLRANRTNVNNYNASDQIGAGSWLRLATIARDQEAMQKGLRAIEVTLSGSLPDGSFVHVERLDNTRVRRVTGLRGKYLDASLLGDFCLGLLVADAGQPISAEYGRRNSPPLARSLRSLKFQAQALLQFSASRPDQLMTMAGMFHSCGLLLKDQKAQAMAIAFAQQATKNTTYSGVWTFGGKTDTSLAASTNKAALDLMSLKYEYTSKQRIEEIVGMTASWLLERIDSDGELNSKGNAYSCVSKRAFDSKLSGINLRDLLFSLYRGGFYLDRGDMLGAAEKVVNRLNANNVPDGFCFFRA